VRKGFGLLVVLFLLVAGTFYFNPLWVVDQLIRWKLSQQHVKSEYVQVDGYRIHYFEAMPAAGGAGTPLVLVHGLGSRGEDWSSLIPALAAAGFHVYVPDLLGYGRSSKPDVDYSISLQEKTVVDFMKAMKIEHADVGGWSMGGWVALKLTLDQPAMVDRLVAFDAAGIYFPARFDASLFTPKDETGLAKLTAMLTPHPMALPGFAARAAVRKLQDNAWVLQRSVAAMEGGKDLLDFHLQQITRPTLIVWGSQDTLIPPSVGETMRRQIPGASMLLVQGCGHLTPAECSKPVLAGTIGFLKSEPAWVGVDRTVAGQMK